MHIFADLQPYICTFADCEDTLAQFPNRHAWAEHEFSQHRITSSWSCPECPQVLTSVSDWQSHIQDRHCLVFSVPNLNVAKHMAYKTEPTRIEDDECPLCRTVVGKPRRAFVKHVARHMEEIALMALPRNVEEDSEEGSVTTDRTSLEESRTSFHLKPGLETDVIAREAKARPNGSILPVMPNYEKLTVVELRNELVARGLPKTGLKAALVQRLIEAVAPFACEQCDQKFFQSQGLK